MQTLNTICVIGAGTMGSGIAQVAAQAGYYTILYDVNADGLTKAKANINTGLQYLLNKQKITNEQHEQISQQIIYTSDINDCIADVFIEAIIEQPEAKIALFNQLAELNHGETIFASNTSSLSITQLQQGILHPQRVVGMHFFNPAPVMKLVEVIKGQHTADVVVQTICQLCQQMQKQAVICTDAPGFIVNRVARHYYLQAMQQVQTHGYSLNDADALLEAVGFKMGPFKLMDMIGLDINLAVSQSLYQAFNNAPRFAPAQMQINKVASGQLGRKTKQGFYAY
jgi:3-hydroxybutyryl-CoA dehydrogenase